jgi:ribonuclease HI
VHLYFALESDKCTNNIIAYEAVILGLRKLRALGVTTCIVKTDSKIVAGQIEMDCSAKEPVLMQYLSAVRSLKKQFKGFTLQHIEQNKNEEANMFAKAAAKGEPLLAMAELPELFQLKCLSPALEARPHLNGNNPSIPRI